MIMCCITKCVKPRRPRPGVDGPAAAGQTRRVTEWIYFVHPPRDDFAGELRPFRVSLLRGRT